MQKYPGLAFLPGSSDSTEQRLFSLTFSHDKVSYSPNVS